MAITIVQKAFGGGASGATFASPVTIGNVIFVMTMTRDSATAELIDTGTSGTPDATFTTIYQLDAGNVPGKASTWFGGKIATATTQSFHSIAYHHSKGDRIVLYELAGSSLADRMTLATPFDNTHIRSFNAGDFDDSDAVAGSMAFGGIMYIPDGPIVVVTYPSGWTQDENAKITDMYFWSGHIAGADINIPTAFSIPSNGYNELATSGVFVLIGEATLPSANFEGTPTDGIVPLEVQFSDLSSGTPTSWAWTFGDGSVSTEQNPVYLYTKPGSYDVSLTVTNGDGSDSVTRVAYITVSSAPVLPRLRDRILLSIRASFNDEKLFNHAQVVATGNKAQIYYGEAMDTDPGSPTNIDSIGDRVFRVETDLITTQETANKAALKAFLDNCLISEDITLEAICNPALEGNDVVGVQETEFTQLERNFRIQAFTVPLSSSRQTLKLARVIDLQTQTVSVNDDIILVGFKQTIKSTAGTSASVDLPDGVEDGDLLLMWVALDGGPGETTPTVSGFHSISGTNKWRTRIANSDSGPFSVSWSGSRRGIVTLLAYRNVDQTNPIAKLVAGSDTGKTVTIPGMTLASGEYHLVAAALSNGVTSYTWPAAWTEETSADTGGTGTSHVGISIADKPRVGANPPAFNITAADNLGETVYQIALRKDIS